MCFVIVHSEMQNQTLDKCTFRNNDLVWTQRTLADLRGEDSMFCGVGGSGRRARICGPRNKINSGRSTRTPT